MILFIQWSNQSTLNHNAQTPSLCDESIKMITEEVGKGGDDFEGKDKEAQGTGLS